VDEWTALPLVDGECPGPHAQRSAGRSHADAGDGRGDHVVQKSVPRGTPNVAFSLTLVASDTRASCAKNATSRVQRTQKAHCPAASGEKP
jgi:hypothetical protein